MHRRHRSWPTALVSRVVGIGLVLAIGSGVASRAEAQQLVLAPVDLQAFRPAMDSKGYITLNSSQVLGQLDFSFGLVSTWGSKVLDFTNPTAPLTTPGGQTAYRRHAQ